MLGDRIKSLRENRRVSQIDLAAVLGVSKSTVSMWETGRREPDSAMLVNIAQYFNCSVDYLLGRSGNAIDGSVLDAVNSIDDDLLEKFGNIFEALRAQRARNGLLTDDELTHIKKYRTLDGYGRKAVDSVLDVEYERCAADTDTEQARRVIPYSLLPASAGLGEWIDENKFSEITIPDIPEYSLADFAVRVHGDSMLPDYEDGDIALVHTQAAINDGDTGLFWVEGEGGFIKVLKRGSLYPLNNAYEPVALKGKEYRCFGKVIGKLENK